MTAIGLGMKEIRSGEARAAICGGFESLSNAPILWPRQRARRIGDVSATDPLLMRGVVVDRPIPVYSGDESVRHGVDRRQQDEWAVQSHQRYFAADRAGYFDAERFPVETTDRKGPRQVTTSPLPTVKGCLTGSTTGSAESTGGAEGAPASTGASAPADRAVAARVRVV